MAPLRPLVSLAAALACGAALPGAPAPAFLPPEPPPLGAPLNAPPAGAKPSPLAPYVAEPFFVPLAWAMTDGEAGGLAGDLESYLGAEAALLTELRAHFDVLRESAPAERAAALQRFAPDQTPRIARLEQDAERLRTRLAALPGVQAHYRAALQELGSGNDADAVRELAAVVAGCADGPDPAQRRALRAMAEQPVPGALSFCPDGARLHRQDVPPAGSDALAGWSARKSALEAGLRGLLLDPERRENPQAWRDLARDQREASAALEEQAEHLRETWARTRDPATPPQASVPAPLAGRIADYRARKLALQRAVLDRVEAIRRSLPASAPDAPERMRRAIDAFTSEQHDAYAALDRDRDQLRADLAALLGPRPGTPGASADALLRDFTQSLRQLQTYWNYHDYQFAVLQPGLSPEQRRLLFMGAVLKLNLPMATSG